MSDVATAPPDGRGELIGRLKSKLKDAMVRLKAAEERATKAEGQVEEARKAAVEAESKYSVEPLKGEVDRLKGEIRTGKHRAAFNEAATAAGAPKDALDLLWRESGWKADADEPDGAAIGKAVETLKGRADIARLFGGEATQAEEKRPAPGSGQGSRVSQGSRVKATSADLKDPDWCFRNRNALKAKMVDLVD